MARNSSEPITEKRKNETAYTTKDMGLLRCQEAIQGEANSYMRPQIVVMMTPSSPESK